MAAKVRSNPEETVDPAKAKSSKKVIRNPSDPSLSWFRKADYSGLTQLTDLGWYYQIESRREILLRLDGEKERPLPLSAELVRLIDCVRNTPVVTLTSLEASNIPWSHNFLLAIFLEYPACPQGVRRMDFARLADIFENLLLDAEIRFSNDNMEPLLDQDENLWQPSTRNRVLGRAFAHQNELLYLFGAEAIDDPEVFPHSSTALFELTHSVNYDIMKSELNALLQVWRRSDLLEEKKHGLPELHWKPRRPRRTTKKPWIVTTESIIKDRVIQFMDLVIWEEQFDARIVKKTKAALLFSDRVDPCHIERPYCDATLERYRTQGKNTRTSVPKTKMVNIVNRIDSIENMAWYLAEKYTRINSGFEVRAAKELVKAYDSGKGNPEFVPSNLLRRKISAELYEACPVGPPPPSV